VEPDEFGTLLIAVWGYQGSPITTAALKLMALLYPRPGELRQATWSEFDLEKRTWAIPSERAKMRREHQKPLSVESVRILKALFELTGHRDLVFPAQGAPRRPMSENTMNQALRRMGFGKDQATSHGFRASASSLLNESGKWSSDAIEAELAHVETNGVRRAYHRALYWEERQKMTEWWADEIARLRDIATS
jgi:integrase